MIEVVGVSFKKNGKVYYFSPNGIKVEKDDNVIVKTERGLQFGTVEVPNKEISSEQLTSALSNIVRMASKKDVEQMTNF